MLYWPRMVVSGLWFLLSGVFMLIVTAMRPGDTDNNKRVGRTVSVFFLKLWGIDFRIDGEELLEQETPCVYIINHQSNMDAFLFSSIIPRKTVVIGKNQLKWLPVFGQLYLLCGNILIDRGRRTKAINTMKEVSRKMKEKNASVLIAPEGTRSRGRGLLPFKKGPFYLAVQLQIPIRPLSMSDFQEHVDLNRWKAGNVDVVVRPTISTKGKTLDDIGDLMLLARNSMKEGIEIANKNVQSR